MSLHPLKKSDQKKAWMKGRRDKARMVQPEYHLIVTEGVETEPQYFGAVQRIINGTYRQRIQLQIEGVGDNTLNLLERARQYAENSGMVFKHVWVVYDTDDFPPEHINRTARLCAQYSKPGETLYTQFGPISALNCGFCCIFLIFTPTCTEINIGASSVPISRKSARVLIGKTVPISMRCCGPIWTGPLKMRKSWRSSTKGNSPRSPHRGPRCMS